MKKFIAILICFVLLFAASSCGAQVPNQGSSADNISVEEVKEIAEEYWHVRDGLTDGAAGTLTVTRIIVSQNPYISESDYHVVLQKQYFYSAMLSQNYDEKTSTPHEMKNMAEILVNLVTGEITPLPDLWPK